MLHLRFIIQKNTSALENVCFLKMLTPSFPYCGNKTLTSSLTLLETLQSFGRSDYIEIIILMHFLHRTY